MTPPQGLLWIAQPPQSQASVSVAKHPGVLAIAESMGTVLLAVVKGEQNPTTAYMTGKLKIKGDMGAALKLQKLF